MPVSMLIVEGKLDELLLTPILCGSPPVLLGGSKNALAPKAREERRAKRTHVCYLRDRDFDFDPPADTTQPTVDRMQDGNPLGWRWCRHEIENYLLEPDLVTVATGWDKTSYVDRLLEAARRIRFYQIGRWVVGTARRSLPPNYELQTRPDSSEFQLPDDLAVGAIQTWVREHTTAFFERVRQTLDSAAIESELATRTALLTEPFLDSASTVLLWCSGKDLLAALNPWLQTQGTTAGNLRASLRDWARAHPEDVLIHLPEWNRLVQILRA
jgi:hypothetical protein